MENKPVFILPITTFEQYFSRVVGLAFVSTMFIVDDERKALYQLTPYLDTKVFTEATKAFILNAATFNKAAKIADQNLSFICTSTVPTENYQHLRKYVLDDDTKQKYVNKIITVIEQIEYHQPRPAHQVPDVADPNAIADMLNVAHTRRTEQRLRIRLDKLFAAKREMEITIRRCREELSQYCQCKEVTYSTVAGEPGYCRYCNKEHYDD